MIHLRLPFDEVRPLPFYLAMEEWAARTLPVGRYFFCWRVEPTVVCGRNQDIAAEVNLDYCRDNGIPVVRRRSGGGAVFADMQNYMFSYIAPGDAIQSTFSAYTTMIADMLCRLGIDAQANGRNDIVAGGRKISGNAFYHLPGRCIVHGTMLYGLDSTHMQHALTPSRAKLVSKAVKSVSMRVGCLRDMGLELTLEEFGRKAIEMLTDSEHMLCDADVQGIEALEQRYYDPEFIRCEPRELPAGCIRRSSRIDGVGEISATVALTADGTHIRGISLDGDFFLLDDVDSLVCRRLEGVEFCEAAVVQALSQVDVGKVIAGLDSISLARLIVQYRNTLYT